MNDDVWLVIPLYNEETVIEDVVRQARMTFPNVCCVDDGSSDGSVAAAQRGGAVVVSHPVNLGQGAALQTGFEYVRSDPQMAYAVTYDADGQHQVADVSAMVSGRSRWLPGPRNRRSTAHRQTAVPPRAIRSAALRRV